MFVVGVTGGIGSGKSAATDILSQLGVTVVDADIVAREVVEPGEPALQAIKEYFGSEVIATNGSLDRAALRKLVFSNNDNREWLEKLLHPIIRKSIIEQLNRSNGDYAVLASPLLLETDQYQLVDHVVVIDVPVEIQLQRTMSRDNNNEEQVKAIINAQMARQERLDKADSVISNDSDLAHLDTEISTLHEQLIQLAKQA
ncbi:dephospho-CoA kinase [Neptuniibacter sp.]|uniref:dephospho-CoA kinase n=1 Tax=Neptuniibacter sp. TaxID=1962643 RepID=UPI00262D30F4|nr:dephospho-CoA kinase [Neptuniibacter sp.]MCP4598128.1 dephospho-CoA kinase [Neptuniibacter sp.]